MTSNEMNSQMSNKQGFIAALDQSGGSTPGALRYYGIPDSAYSGETEMFKLMHEMRVRIMSSPAFTGDKVIGAILFEGTMDGQAKGKPVPAFLWDDRGVVPFLKVDKGLETEKDGVSLMKPIPGLDSLLERAAKLGDLRHENALDDPLAVQNGHRGHCGPAIRAWSADRGAWTDADPGTRSFDQEPRQTGRRSDSSRGTRQRTG